MKKTYLTCVLMVLAGCSTMRPPEDWSRRDSAMTAAAAATIALDAYSTSRLAAHGYVEEQPLSRMAMGAQPDTKGIVLYFASLMAVDYLIARHLPPRLRPYWLGTVTATHLAEGGLRNCGRLDVC